MFHGTGINGAIYSAYSSVFIYQPLYTVNSCFPLSSETRTHMGDIAWVRENSWVSLLFCQKQEIFKTDQFFSSQHFSTHFSDVSSSTQGFPARHMMYLQVTVRGLMHISFHFYRSNLHHTKEHIILFTQCIECS